MYLLDSQVVMDLFSRDEERSVFSWLKEERRQIFISVLTIGQLNNTVDDMLEPTTRNHWRRLCQEGARTLEEQGSLIDIDKNIVEIWQANLRGNRLEKIPQAGDLLGEDDRLIIATAIARNYTFVTMPSQLISEIAKHTALTTLFL